MTRNTKKKIISIALVLFGIVALIAGIMMLQNGFGSFDDNEPRVGLYIGGIFTTIGGVFSTVGGIVVLKFDGLKKNALRLLGKIADAIEESKA